MKSLHDARGELRAAYRRLNRARRRNQTTTTMWVLWVDKLLQLGIVEDYLYNTQKKRVQAAWAKAPPRGAPVLRTRDSA